MEMHRQTSASRRAATIQAIAAQPIAAPLVASRLVASLLWATLAFALFAGSTAYAQPGADEARVTSWLDIRQSPPAPTTICVGDRVIFIVSLQREVVFVVGPQLVNFDFRRRVIFANVADSAVGAISPPQQPTAFDGTSQYIFTAKREGSTTITFQSDIDGIAFFGLPLDNTIIKNSTSIRVEDCSYRVTTDSRWSVAGPANIRAFAFIRRAGLVYAGGLGERYTGTADVYWVITVGNVGECQGVTRAHSEAYLTGTYDDSDHFIVGIDYRPVDLEIIANCRGLLGRMPVVLSPGAITVTLDPEGGRSRPESQQLGDPDRTVGTARVSLERAPGR